MMGFPPGVELRSNLSISSAGKSSRGWVHEDLSFSGALKVDQSLATQSASNSASVRGGFRTRLRGVSAST